MNLIDVYAAAEGAPGVLYALLVEREPSESISHKQMPTFNQHQRFVDARPYECWYLITDDSAVGPFGYAVGAIYLTGQREIGVSILKAHRRKGYAKQAIAALLGLHPGPCLANVAPSNAASIALFEGLGGQHIQSTYRIP